MTPDELQAIKARAEKATPGPWDTFGYDETPLRFYTWRVRGPDHFNLALDLSKGDAEFIAVTRTDVPALVTAVERLQVEKGSLIARIKDQQAALARLDAENAQLRALVEQVEWAGGPRFTICPWCGGKNPSDYLQTRPEWWNDQQFGEFEPYHPWPGEIIGHKPDCPRQAALKGGTP